MSVTYGSAHLPAPPIARSQFDTLAQRLFRSSGGCDADRLWEMAQTASEADHGTMLVVSASAPAEAERLSAQALLVEPVAPTMSLLRQVTSIDGAVLVDPTGSLYAIGVILDGSATPEGDRARGARFNSAVRYLSATTSPTLIVLVSEDGTLDLLPQLQPQIRRSDLDGMLQSLRTAAAMEPVAPQAFYNAFRPVKAAEFYLSPEQCDEVNRLVADHWNRREASGSDIRFIEPPLRPNPAMSDECFLD